MSRTSISRLILLAALASLALVFVTAETTETPATLVEGTSSSFGEGVTLETRTPIAEILANPEAFKGQTVAIEGKVVGVCAMMGCWVELESATKERMRIKVDDGVIVFPQEAQGQNAVAQGKVEILEYTKEQYEEKLRHEADEMGHKFDPASIGPPPYREVRLWGSGAVIETGS